MIDLHDAAPQGAHERPDDSRRPQRIKERLEHTPRALLQYLWPNGRVVGTEFKVGSVNGEKGSSLSISLRPEKLGVGCDFAGQEVTRDLIDCWSWARRGRDTRGADFGKMLDDIEVWLGRPYKPAPRKSANGHDKPPELGPPTKVYHYTDADGVELVTVTRYDPPGRGKEFRPWTAGLGAKAPESNRPLYNQPGIKNEAWVVFCEGEKAAQALIDSGIAATSAMNGSKAPVDKTDWSPLAGKHVVIWPDADEPGYQFATAVSLALASLAASVRVLEVPDGKVDGWDAADAIAEGMDVRGLLFVATEPPAPQPAHAFSIQEWNADRYKGKAEPYQWLIKDVMPLGCAGILAAMGDAGKGVMTLDLAIKVACRPPATGGGLLNDDGIPAMSGRVITHGAAVIFTAEDSETEVHRRLNALDPDDLRHAPGSKLFVIPLPNVGGPMPLVTVGPKGPETTPAYDDILRQLLEIPDLRLVVFDPLSSFVLGDLNRDQAVCSYATGLLAAVATQTGATVLVCHHMTKGNSKTPITTPEMARDCIRGSSALVDGVRLAYALWPAETQEARVICRKLNVEWRRNSVFKGAVAKSNAPADREVHTFIRDMTTGLLKDRTAELNRAWKFTSELLVMLIEAVAEAADAGLPYTVTGKAGLWIQRDRLNEELRELSKHRLEHMAQEALELGNIMQAKAPGSNVPQWLDVPGGPFATGTGQFRDGGDPSKPGPMPKARKHVTM